MRGPAFLLLAGSLLACEQKEQPIESGRRFVTTVYTDSQVEEFARTTRHITGTIASRNGDTLRYTATLGDSGLVRTVAIVATPGAARGRDRQAVHAVFVVPKGSMPILFGSVALWEQMLRRARAIGGDSISIPTVLVGRDGTRNIMTVTSNGPDSVVFTPQDDRGGNELRFAVDTAWRITGGILPLSHTVMAQDSN